MPRRRGQEEELPLLLKTLQEREGLLPEGKLAQPPEGELVLPQGAPLLPGELKRTVPWTEEALEHFQPQEVVALQPPVADRQEEKTVPWLGELGQASSLAVLQQKEVLQKRAWHQRWHPERQASGVLRRRRELQQQALERRWALLRLQERKEPPLLRQEGLQRKFQVLGFCPCSTLLPFY